MHSLSDLVSFPDSDPLVLPGTKEGLYLKEFLFFVSKPDVFRKHIKLFRISQAVN